MDQRCSGCDASQVFAAVTREECRAGVGSGRLEPGHGSTRLALQVCDQRHQIAARWPPVCCRQTSSSCDVRSRRDAWRVRGIVVDRQITIFEVAIQGVPLIERYTWPLCRTGSSEETSRHQAMSSDHSAVDASVLRAATDAVLRTSHARRVPLHRVVRRQQHVMSACGISFASLTSSDVCEPSRPLR